MELAISTRLSPPQNELFRNKLAAIEVDPIWENDAEPDVIYLCGLPASLLLDNYRPLAAPFLTEERYRGQPWYFIDVIGRPGETSDQTWAFNQTSSFSGWLAVHHGFQVERRSPKDVDWLETGSHLASLESVRSGKADRAGIDSMILDLEPHLLEGLEVVTTWGPWPSPPVMVARHLSDEVIDRLADLFTSDRGGTWLPLAEDHLTAIAAVASSPLAAHMFAPNE